MIDSLFLWQSVREKHRRSPLLHEREQYLAHLAHRGISLPRTRAVANLLLHVVRLMELSALRPIELEEIDDAGAQWAADRAYHSPRTLGATTATDFRYVAGQWLSFHRMLVVPSEPTLPFQELLKKFLYAMQVERGLSSDTLRGYGSRAWYFLQWFAGRSTDLARKFVLQTQTNIWKELNRLSPMKPQRHWRSRRFSFEWGLWRTDYLCI